jgi:hypothetical protein
MHARSLVDERHVLRRSAFLACIAAGCIVLPVRADDWPGPVVQAKSSAQGTYVVRVVPGRSIGDVVGFAGAEKGPYATAEWYRNGASGYQKARTAALLNPVAPVDIEVAESGNLVTLDNWHNRGHGTVLAIYSPTGEVLKRYRLADLYAEQEIRRMKMSVSSIHWRCAGASTAFETPRELRIDDSIGGRLRVNVETGAVRHERDGGSCGK